MTDHTCGRCRFFVADPANIQSGQCRANPPAPLVVGARNGRAAVNGVHPPVARTHWCGAWVERKPALPAGDVVPLGGQHARPERVNGA